MSHANGQVRFQDGTTMHFEYDGTADMAISRLYDTNAEVHENWRADPRPHNKCGCENGEPVKIATDYGNGYWWTGMACKQCRAIWHTHEWGLLVPDEAWSDDHRPLPDWWV